MKNKKMVYILYLHLIILLYSASSIFIKVTANMVNQYGICNIKVFITLFIAFLLMGIYAIFWQIILKNMELSFAYMNKGITVVWSLIGAALIFHEQIKFMHIIGTAFIVAGIVLIAKDKEA